VEKNNMAGNSFNIWKKDGTIFFQEDRFKGCVHNNTLTITFSNIQPDDTGPLHCIARTSFGIVTCHVELTCEEKPTILTSTQEVVALIGGSAVLEAQARGTPKPIISWSHAGQIIQPSSRFKCLEDVGTFSLIITGVTDADAGTFTVTALNKHGVETVNIDLIVKRKFNKFSTGRMVR
jgi:hypothetical protein